MLLQGETNRVIGQHQLNRESSRSHSVFIAHTTCVHEGGDGTATVGTARYGSFLATAADHQACACLHYDGGGSVHSGHMHACGAASAPDSTPCYWGGEIPRP